MYTDKINLDVNEEEMEKEILINLEDGEEVQDVYAFDMQINDEIYTNNYW